jgi:hypothetical protein
MSKRSTDMREQHVQLLKGISIWLDQQPDTNELEKAVFNEIVQRVKERSPKGQTPMHHRPPGERACWRWCAASTSGSDWRLPGGMCYDAG